MRNGYHQSAPETLLAQRTPELCLMATSGAVFTTPPPATDSWRQRFRLNNHVSVFQPLHPGDRQSPLISTTPPRRGLQNP